MTYLFLALVSFILIYNVSKIFIDLCFLFFPKIKAKVLFSAIEEKNSSYETFYFMSVTYEYQNKGETIVSSDLNAFNNVYSHNFMKLQKILENKVKDGYINVYVCPFCKRKSYAFPLYWNKIFPVSSIALMLIILIILKFLWI